jgi:hypothetical protein
MRMIPQLPTDPIAAAALQLARATESESVFNHSVRSYVSAVLLAEHENATGEADYDPALLFAATVAGRSGARFGHRYVSDPVQDKTIREGVVE